MPDSTKPIVDTEIVINYSPDYVANATKLTFNTPKRYAFPNLLPISYFNCSALNVRLFFVCLFSP